MIRGGLPSIATREAAVQLGLLLDAGLGLYGLSRLWPRVRVLEARSGWLRFGPWSWNSRDVAYVEMRKVIIDVDTVSADASIAGAMHTRIRGMEVWRRAKEGGKGRVWAVWGRESSRAGTWVRHIAELASAPLKRPHR